MVNINRYEIRLTFLHVYHYSSVIINVAKVLPPPSTNGFILTYSTTNK